jgi:hypothetical protein
MQIELDEREANVLSAAIIQYYEMILEEHARVSAEINRLNAVQSPILQGKLEYFNRDMHLKLELIEVIGGLWGKIVGFSSPSEQVDDNETV